MIENEIKVFSPATVANVSCGFDVLGLAIDGVGDTLAIRKSNLPGARISRIEGADLPMESDKNIASYVAGLMLEKAGADFGLEMDIYKGVLSGSGLGSSASSCAAAAVGTNYFLEEKFSREELIEFAAEGERVACGTPITDNVAAAIIGGIVLIFNPQKLQFISLPVPEDLFVVVIHPQLEILTEQSRKVLAKNVPLERTTRQMANLGGFITALFRNDYKLMSESMTDLLAEPYRKELIKGYQSMRDAAMASGAIGGGISGSGPSVFHLCKGEEVARQVYQAVENAFRQENIPYKMYLSKVNMKGTHII